MYSKKSIKNSIGNVPPFYGGTRFEKHLGTDGREEYSYRNMMPVENSITRPIERQHGKDGVFSENAHNALNKSADHTGSEQDADGTYADAVPDFDNSGTSRTEFNKHSAANVGEPCGADGRQPLKEERKGGISELLSKLGSDDLLIIAIIILLASEKEDSREIILLLVLLLATGR